MLAVYLTSDIFYWCIIEAVILSFYPWPGSLILFSIEFFILNVRFRLIYMSIVVVKIADLLRVKLCPDDNR